MKRYLLCVALVLAVTGVMLTAQGRQPTPPSSIWQECLAVQNGTSRGIILTDALTGTYLGSVRPYSSNRICD